jgi:hypothetical protein
MKVFAKPGRASCGVEDVRAQLLAVFDACSRCEVAATLAADTFRQRRVAQGGLVACATVCGDAALQLACLRVPDAARVADELAAVRAACARARETCEALADDAVVRRCALECRRCEEACASVASIAMLAA